MYDFSLNQVRVRDVIADDSHTFEVHKLEHLKVCIGKSKSENKGGLIMRLECESQDAKDEWVKAINHEVKQIRSKAKMVASQFLIEWNDLNNELFTSSTRLCKLFSIQ